MFNWYLSMCLRPTELFCGLEKAKNDRIYNWGTSLDGKSRRKPQLARMIPNFLLSCASSIIVKPVCDGKTNR